MFRFVDDVGVILWHFPSAVVIQGNLIPVFCSAYTLGMAFPGIAETLIAGIYLTIPRVAAAQDLDSGV